MLKLRYDTEDWLEALVDSICRAEAEVGLDSEATEKSDYDDLADELCSDVLRYLSDQGVDYGPAYQQSVGAFAIVQGGDDDERAAFDAAFEKCEKEIYQSVVAKAREFAEALAEDADEAEAEEVED